MKLSIIIPLYNEEKSITQLLDKVLSVQFEKHTDSYEVVIVDDCSADKSYSIVSGYIADKPQFQLFQNEKNMGKGAAVKHGVSKCSGDTIIIQDADLELSPLDIPSMIKAMKDLNVEFINGSRYLPGLIRPVSSFSRYWGNRLFTNLTAILINVKITDMACGYKLIKKSLWDQISLKENRFGFEAELIIKALRIKKNNVAEVPVQYFPRNEGEGKKLRNSDGFKILWTIFKWGVLIPSKRQK
ncbi:glycosyltransferase family 2 protein [Prolixibacteraceae bacterium JC049]|nr:glycosyltransferase family 2 protein [Prolixibacteraceae bacterium JC049]